MPGVTTESTGIGHQVENSDNRVDTLGTSLYVLQPAALLPPRW